MTEKQLKAFIRLAKDGVAYDAPRKERFHRIGRQVLRAIVNKMDLEPGTYTIRSNYGGIAVSGEVILHTDHLYVQLYQSSRDVVQGFMYRYCENQSDYTGGKNRWLPWDALADLDRIAAEFKRTMTKQPGDVTWWQ